MVSGTATQIKYIADNPIAVTPKDFLNQITFRFIILITIQQVVLIGVIRSKHLVAHSNTFRTASQTCSNWLSVSANPEAR